MSTITESYPFCYAIKNGSQIRLHILVKVPANHGITFPAAENRRSGQRIYFDITLSTTGNTPGHQYKHYDFAIGEGKDMIDQIEIKTKLNNNTIKTMKIDVEDLDVVGVDGLTLPTLNGDGTALNTPYVCTKLLESPPGTYIGFDSEAYVLPPSPVSFTVAHSNPSGTPKDSSTTITTGTGTATELSEKFTFSQTDIHTTDGAHTATFNGRKGKTKNRNHTVTPFPRRVPRS